MLNIAHLAAGFKSQTHVYCDVIAKAVCLLPSYLLIRQFPEYPLPNKQSRFYPATWLNNYIVMVQYPDLKSEKQEISCTPKILGYPCTGHHKIQSDENRRFAQAMKIVGCIRWLLRFSESLYKPFPSTRYISSQSGETWHSLLPE